MLGQSAMHKIAHLIHHGEDSGAIFLKSRLAGDA